MSKISVEIISLFEGLALPLAQRGEPSPWGPGMMGNWGYGMMGWFGAIMMLVFWGLIIFVLILLARWLWGSSQKKSEEMRSESPLDILKRRYASGEIDREEFEQKKKDLSGP
ncbi:MAG: SHOCT domain-containing protein [Syntrophobacteria bacterium]|jgi:putative membrane protein